MGDKRRMRFPRLLLSLIVACTVAQGETVKDREGAVRKDRATMENDGRWMYNDIESGFAAAKKSGKPLLVVLRCVPCLSCMGIDSSVLTEPSLQPLLDQFVCVRVINANALDLSKFQFDYDLSFSAMFFDADGTVLGRFGSWTHQKDSQDTNTASFRRALEAVQSLHQRLKRGLSENKLWFAGKQGGPTPFKTPVEIPVLAEKYKRDLDWEGKVVQSCVHCHQIGEAYRTMFRDKGEPIPSELIYPMPGPETIGLTLAPDQIGHVDAVAPGSAAEAAGIKAGDELQMVNGDPLVSIADVAWALNHAPESGILPITARRGTAGITANLKLEKGWRMKSDISRRVGTWQMRGMALGGLVLEDLPDAEREPRKLGTNVMGLRVKGVGQYGKHAAGKNAGFQKEDVIVEFDGVSTRQTEGEIIGRTLQAKRVGEKVKVSVLRGTEQLELSLPMQ
jgi:serine protease Do